MDSEGGKQPRTIAQGIILVTRQSSIQIGGLTVVERMVYAMERAGVHTISLIAFDGPDAAIAMPRTRSRETRLRWCKVEYLPGAEKGNFLLFLRPVVIDSAAVQAVLELGVMPAPVIALNIANQSGKTTATGAYIIAGDATNEIRRRVADAGGNPSGQAAAGEEAQAIVSAGVCCPIVSADTGAEIRTAENALIGSMRKNTDGFLAYWLDRRISTAISRYLVRTPVTPNQISLVTLVPALVGAVLIAASSTLVSGAGALLFWLSTILDGCDGEVARLKYLESPQGARLDLLCDGIGLIAVFVGVIMHVYWQDSGPNLFYAGGAIIGGMVAATVLEYLLITRRRIQHGGDPGALSHEELKRRELYERLASRDFAYLLPILAFTGTLIWFVWATAVGVNLFWIALVTIVVRKPMSRAPASTTPGPSCG